MTDTQQTSVSDLDTAASHETPSVGRLERRIRRGALWSVLNALLMRFCNIAVIAVVVRLVTPEDFGVFTVAITVTTVIASIAEFGASSCLSRADLDPDELGPSVAFVSIFGCAVITAALVLAAPLLADVFAASRATNVIRVVALTLLIEGFSAAPGALLAREFQQGRLLVINLSAFAVSNSVLVMLAAAGYGAMSFAFSRVVGAVITCVGINFAVTRRYWPKPKAAALRTVMRVGAPLAGANLVTYLLLNADYLLVGRQLGVGLLGVYTLAFSVASWPAAVLGTTINSVAMPAFSRVGSDVAELGRALRRSTRIVALVAFLIASLTCGLAGPLIDTLYGPKWHRAISVLAVLAVYGALFVLVLLLSNLLVGIGATATVLAVQCCWIAVLVPLMFCGVHLADVDGVAWAHVAVIALIVAPLYIWRVSNRLPGVIRLLTRCVGPPLLIGIASAGMAIAVAHFVHPPLVALAAGGVAGGGLYLVLAAPMFGEYLSVGRHRAPGRFERRLAGRQFWAPQQ